MRRLLMVLALLAAAGPARAQQGAPDEAAALEAVSDWFRVGAAALDHWAPSLPDPTDDRRILFTPRAPRDGVQRTVMVIYPRRSSAYDTAMTTLLADFAARPHALRFLAVNYDRDPARGARLVRRRTRRTMR